MIKRFFDLVISFIAIIVLLIPYLSIAIIIRLTSSGPIIYWSNRVGKNGNLFMMPKFRTMKLNAPEVATDKLLSPEQYLTKFGPFLRRSSFDETPQFFSVLKGDMSLVGPRPALYNQYYIISKRKEFGMDVLKPGITGWAQINGRDELTLDEKISLDYEYLKRQSIKFDLQIIVGTIIKVLRKKNVLY